jgi:biotin-(acetyl-CoA carboxylase) ligase
MQEQTRPVTSLPGGFTLRTFDSLPSSNDWTLERIRAGRAQPGEVCVAREQPGARGRSGRQWLATEGGLWFTVALPLHASHVGWAGMAAALAVCRALDALGLRAGVKWPNDVVIVGRKLAGVLVEGVAGRELAAVGVGLNVRNDVMASGKPPLECGGLTPLSSPAAASRPPHGSGNAHLLASRPGSRIDSEKSGVKPPHPKAAPLATWPPTSVSIELGQVVEPDSLLAPVLAEMSQLWTLWAARRVAELRELWVERDACRGRRVRVLPDGPEGVADGIELSGALRVQLTDGSVRLAMAGEVAFLDRPVGEEGNRS